MNRILTSFLPLVAVVCAGAQMPAPTNSITETSRIARYVPGPGDRPQGALLRNGTFVSFSPALAQRLPGSLPKHASLQVVGEGYSFDGSKAIQAHTVTIAGVSYSDAGPMPGGPNMTGPAGPPAGGPAAPPPPPAPGAPPPPPRDGRVGPPPPPPRAGRGAPPPPPAGPVGAPGAAGAAPVAPPPPPPPPDGATQPPPPPADGTIAPPAPADASPASPSR